MKEKEKNTEYTVHEFFTKNTKKLKKVLAS